jgi:hypothetical protein
MFDLGVDIKESLPSRVAFQTRLIQAMEVSAGQLLKFRNVMQVMQAS